MSIVLQGSTSGSITLQEPAVAGSTVLTLPAVTGTILTTGSTGQVIPKAALPTGSVLQVVNAITSTETGVSSSTYADTTLSATITPLYSTSKILVLINQNGIVKLTNETNAQIRLLRDATVLQYIDSGVAYTGTSTGNAVGGISYNYLDSPATTSAITYKTQFASRANNAAIYVQWSYSTASTSSITLMEIAA